MDFIVKYDCMLHKVRSWQFYFLENNPCYRFINNQAQHHLCFQVEMDFLTLCTDVCSPTTLEPEDLSSTPVLRSPDF